MSWSKKSESIRGLRNICRKKFHDEVFAPLKVENNWKILIIDDFAMSILTSLFQTEEITNYNIALIEHLDKTREAVPYMSAIYIFQPSVKNVALLQNDFVGSTIKYLDVYLFFLTSVSDKLFDDLVKTATPGQVQGFKEIDLQFLPCESQVFSMNDKTFFPTFFDAYTELNLEHCTNIAKQLVTLCTTLNCWPKIRYRRNFVKNMILAEAIQRELCNLREQFQSSSTKLTNQPICEILIMDRGFDCISPLVHECTLQAMTYDLLNIQDDVYVVADEEEKKSDNTDQYSLTEADDLWVKLRHEHIANVARLIEKMFETHSLLRRYPKLSRFKNLPDLGDAVRKHLAFKKSQPQVCVRRMANDCMKKYCEGINVLSNVEQDLSIRAVSEKPSSDMKSTVYSLLLNRKYSKIEKLRLLLLYIFSIKGITKEEFDEIILECELPFSEASIITNVLHLDVDIFRPGFCESADCSSKGENVSTQKIKTKWIPAIKGIMLSCVQRSLSEDKFPFLENDDKESPKTTRRTGYWCTDKKDEYMSRLIIFISGGVTYSEMRCAYEVMSIHRGWEVFIGGDSLLTPKRFYDNLSKLRCFISQDM